MCNSVTFCDGMRIIKYMARVKKTRNCNTMTEAAYFGMLRSVLRRGFRYWKPIQRTKLAARIVYNGENKRRKWSYICAKCGGEFDAKGVQVDHIKPVGSLRSLEDLPQFVANLTQEDGYQVLCKPCHKDKTNEERDGKADCNMQ